MPDNNTILVLENYRHTLVICRSLKALGFKVLLGLQYPQDSGSFVSSSSTVDAIWDHPPFSHPQIFQEKLIELLQSKEDLRAVFPVGESALRCLLDSKVIEKFNLYSVEGIVSRPAETCLDKLETYELASSLGIPCGESVLIKRKEDFQKHLAVSGYSIVLKSNDSEGSVFGDKCFFVNDEASANSVINRWDELIEKYQNTKGVLFQKSFSGQRHNCMFSAVEGRMIKYFESVVLRTDKINGSGYSVFTESIRPVRKLSECTDMLISKLNFTGIGCAQFMFDKKSGDVAFLELNPRIDATVALPFKCGVDFPKEALICSGVIPGKISGSSLIGDSLIVTPGYELNKKIHWLWGDIYSYLQELKAGKLTFLECIVWPINIFKSLILSSYHMSWSSDDPLPTLRVYVGLLFAPFRWVAGKIFS